MTRKVTLTAALLALAASAVATSPAAAAAPAGTSVHAAAFKPLTEATARRIALRLARGVARERDVVSWQLSDAIKVRSNRVVFLYGDRNSEDVFCTARVVVEQTSRVRRTILEGGHCAAIPDEALAIEKATKALVRAARVKTATVRKSVRAYERSLEACEGLVVPRGVQEEAGLLLVAGRYTAFVDPLSAQIDSFVTALQDIQPTDATLVRGVVGWTKLKQLVDALPRAVQDGCGALRQWAANAYTRDSAPVDFESLAASMASLRRQERTIARADERLARLGVTPTAVLGFDPAGLEVLLLGRRVGE
jgi:hypothetical protein